MDAVDIVGGVVRLGRADAIITASPTGKNWVMSHNGILSCIMHDRAIWDDCIRDAILEMKDSREVWDGFFKRNIDAILVPILPNEYKIYAAVRLKELNKSILRASLIPVADIYNERSSTQWVNLGVISQGDGRAALRQMIIGQFAVMMEDDVKCDSFRHNWRRKAVVQQSVKKDKSIALACAWCAFWYEKCYYCYQDDMSAPDTGSKFDPDLIPRH